MGCGASAAKYEPSLPAGKYVCHHTDEWDCTSVDEEDCWFIQGNIITGSCKYEHSISNRETVSVKGKLYYNDTDGDGNHLWRAEWDNKQLSIFRVEGTGERTALHLPRKFYKYRGSEPCDRKDHPVVVTCKDTRAPPATSAEPQSHPHVSGDGGGLPSVRPDGEIRKEQQAQIASGVAERDGKSIKLDPGYADALRKKVQVRCDHVGGIRAMFEKFDLDRSKTMDLNEFIKLMISLPRQYQKASTEVVAIKGEYEEGADGDTAPEHTHSTDKIANLDEDLQRQHLKIHHKGFKEKALTKREATALFWHLDEDESDFLELDELEAWLSTGRRAGLTSWRRGGRK